MIIIIITYVLFNKKVICPCLPHLSYFRSVTQVDPNEIFLELEKEHTNRPSAASDKVVESIIEHFNRLIIAYVKIGHEPVIFLQLGKLTQFWFFDGCVDYRKNENSIKKRSSTYYISHTYLNLNCKKYLTWKSAKSNFVNPQIFQNSSTWLARIFLANISGWTSVQLSTTLIQLALSGEKVFFTNLL